MKMKFIMAAVTAAFILGYASYGPAQQKNGPMLVSELCTKCHGLDELEGVRQNRAGWEDTVYSMVARGAPIYPDEMAVIIDYLSEAFPAETR
jgi:hypothetical protein